MSSITPHIPPHKYPRTFHLPQSLCISNDDHVLPNLDCFDGKRVIITEKMDGENISMSRAAIHSRSLTSNNNIPSRKFVNSLYYRIRHLIPANIQIVGENLQLPHHINYEGLDSEGIKSKFLVFAIFDASDVLDWGATKEHCERLGLSLVPLLYDGDFTPRLIDNTIKRMDFNKSEGFVIRNENCFPISCFHSNVAKFVRANHNRKAEWKRGKEER